MSLFWLYTKARRKDQDHKFWWWKHDSNKFSYTKKKKIHLWKWKWSCSVMSNSLQPMDCSPPSSPVHGFLQARILEWVAISTYERNKNHWTCREESLTTKTNKKHSEKHVWRKLETYIESQGFPGGSDSKESACNSGDLGSIPGSGRFPEEGNGNPLQYFCLKNPMDRGAWRGYSQQCRKELDMTKWLHFLSYTRSRR